MTVEACVILEARPMIPHRRNASIEPIPRDVAAELASAGGRSRHARNILESTTASSAPRQVVASLEFLHAPAATAAGGDVRQ